MRVNWEEYRKMEKPRSFRFLVIPDETTFEIISQYMVRFTLPEPDGLAFVKFAWFFQAAPAFFKKHKAWVKALNQLLKMKVRAEQQSRDRSGAREVPETP